jgi:transposase-like protein
VAGKLPKNDPQLHERVEAACWAALDEATSPEDGEARPRRLVADLERSYPTAAACPAEELPALCVHLKYTLRIRRRLRSTNLLDRSLEEVKRRTKVIGRFPGETSCLSLSIGRCSTSSSPALADSRSPRWSIGSWRRCTPPRRLGHRTR